MDIFSTSTLFGVVREMGQAPSFLRDIFFKPVVHTTETFDIDIIKDGAKVAPVVSIYQGSKTVAKSGFESKSYKAPLIAPDAAMDNTDMFNRMAGENPFQPMDPATRQLAKITEQLMEFDKMISRREEQMAAQVLTTGKVVLEGEDVKYSVDFGLTADTMGTGKFWDDTGVDPMDYLISSVIGIGANGYNGDAVILGTDAYSLLRKNEKFLKMLDIKRYESGLIQPKFMGAGVIFMGTLADLGGAEIYCYAGQYHNGSAMTPYIPAKNVVIGSTAAKNIMHYSAIADVTTDKAWAVARYPRAWKQDKPQARFVAMQSRPLPALHEPNAFRTAKVIK